MTIFILKLLALYAVISIAAALAIGPVIRFGRRYKPPGDLPPLPSGSIDRDRIST